MIKRIPNRRYIRAAKLADGTTYDYYAEVKKSVVDTAMNWVDNDYDDIPLSVDEIKKFILENDEFRDEVCESPSVYNYDLWGYLYNNWGLLADAISEFGSLSKSFIANGPYEWDTVIRNYVYYSVVDEAAEEISSIPRPIPF